MGSKRGSAGIESLSGERVQEEEYLARFVLLQHLYQPRIPFSNRKPIFQSLFYKMIIRSKACPRYNEIDRPIHMVLFCQGV